MKLILAITVTATITALSTGFPRIQYCVAGSHGVLVASTVKVNCQGERK